MSVPESLNYTEDHEWVEDPTASSAKVGLTAFAVDALGDVVFLDLPEVGEELTAGAECGEVESTKSVSSLFAPIGGTVLQVNQAVIDTPELVNQDPFRAGWLFEVTPNGDVAPLLDAAAYRELIAS